MHAVFRAAVFALGLVACKSNEVDQSTVNQNAKCTGAFQHCDPSAPADTCETNTALDVQHCGACGKACGDANGRATCSEGRCTIACSAGFADCNGDPADGCEVDTRTSLDHCGACAAACKGEHAKMECASSKCQIAQCDADWSDCDGTAATGCEIALATDAAHCGACTTSCLRDNGTGTCVAGACALACNTAFHACGGSCVSDTSTSACGATCATCTAPAGGTPVCAAGACDFSCGSLTRCSELCVDLKTSAANCGACGHDCDGGGCDSGLCVPVAVSTIVPPPAPLFTRFSGSTLYGYGAGSSKETIYRLTEPSTWTVAATIPTAYSIRTEANAFATDQSAFYFAGLATLDQVIVRINLATGASTEVVRYASSSNSGVRAITVAGDRVYWMMTSCGSPCTTQTSSLASARLDGSGVVSVPITCGGGPCESATLIGDDTDLYVSVSRVGGGTIPSVTRRNRTTLALVETLPLIGNEPLVALTPTYLYAYRNASPTPFLYRVARSTNTLAPSPAATTLGQTWFSDRATSIWTRVATLGDKLFLFDTSAVEISADGSTRGLIGAMNSLTIRPTGKSEIFFSTSTGTVHRLAR